MKAIIYKILFVVLVIFFFASCQEKIDLELPEGEQFLVVEGWINAYDSLHLVKLSYTAPYFSNVPQPKVKDAVVILEDNEGNEEVLNEIEEGVYEIDRQGIEGREYRLRIHLPEGDTYLSKFELLREPVPIDSIYYQLSDREPMEQLGEKPDQIYDVLIDTYEPEGRGDFYRWRSFVNGVEAQEPSDIVIVTDYLLDGAPVIEFNVTYNLYALGDTVKIIQEHISADAYEFLASIWSQTAMVGSPFDSPPVPIKGNVQNITDPNRPALGFFGAAGVYPVEIIISE